MHLKHLRYAVFATTVLLGACGSSNKDATNGSTLSNSDPSVQVAQEGMSSSSDASGSATTARSQGQAAPNVHALLRLKPACLAFNLVSGAFSHLLDANFKAKLDYTKCAVGGGQSLSGSQNVEVSGDGNSSSVAIFSDLTRTYRNGDTVTVAGLDPAQPTISVTSTSTFDPNNSASQALSNVINVQEHRVRKAASGSEMFDMNITVSGVTVHETLVANALTKRVVSGETTVHHNLAKFKSVITQTDVTTDVAVCPCHPISGTVSQNITYDADSTKPNKTVLRTYTFTSTCGTMTYETKASTDAATTTGSGTAALEACD